MKNIYFEFKGTGFGYAGPAIRGVTTSLLPAAIDLAYKVPDLASTAAMHVLKGLPLNRNKIRLMVFQNKALVVAQAPVLIF